MSKYLFMSAEVENEEPTGRDHTAVALDIDRWIKWLPDMHKKLNCLMAGLDDLWPGRISMMLRDRDLRLSDEFLLYEERVVREGEGEEWCDEVWTNIWLNFYADGTMQITGLFGRTGIAMYTPRFTLDDFKEKESEQ